MKKYFLLFSVALLSLLASTSFAQCPATYTFPGSGALNPADWTQTALAGTSALKESSNTAITTTASTQGMAVWVGSSCSPGDDQSAKITVTTPLSGSTGPMVRANAATGSGYLWLLRTGQILAIDQLGLLSGVANCPQVTVGHTYELDAVGNNIFGFDNGVSVCSGINSSFPTGNAGILVDQRAGSTDSVSNFIVGAAQTIPLANPSAALSTAVFMNADGVNFSYPSIGSNPTYQQATQIRLIPPNIKDVYYATPSAPVAPIGICYTTDGSDPTTPATPDGTCKNGILYTYNAGPSGLINFDGSALLKMLATATGFANTPVISIHINIEPFYPYPAIPGFANGTYSYSPLTPTLNGVFGSNLIYTTDLSVPTADGSCVPTHGTAAANGVQVTLPDNATTTIKFITCAGGVSSQVQSGTYTQRPKVTWYVTASPVGGTRFSANVPTGQCNGQSPNAYVSGTNQPCPFNDIRFLWDDYSGVVGRGMMVMAGGDDVIISSCTAKPGQVNKSDPNCRIGWDIKGGGDPVDNNWCKNVGNAPCTNPWIPAGSPTQKTTFEGKNFASCAPAGMTNPRDYTSQLTQIFGGMGLTHVLNIADTQHVAFSCLEITAHNGACASSGSPNYPRGCSRNSPVDDYAENGFLENNQTSDISMTDVSIHGLNASGVAGPFGANIVPLRVFCGFNGFACWNMDDGFSTPDGVGATLMASYVTAIGNGCYEEYPVIHAFSAQACYDTQSNGFGDVWSGQDTILDTFSCDHCDMELNTKDALIGPHPAANLITITNSKVVGNMGSAWKWISNVNGTLDMHDNLTVANCPRMAEQIPGSSRTFASIFITQIVVSGGVATITTSPQVPLLVPGQTVFFWNFQDGHPGSWLDNQFLTVLSTGLTSTQFQVNVSQADGTYIDNGSTAVTTPGQGGSFLSGYCRAGGNGFAANLLAGVNWKVYNNTFVSNSDDGYHFFVDCGTAYKHPSGDCESASFLIENNVFISYKMNGQFNGPALFGTNDATIVPTFQNNISIGEKPGTGLPCGVSGNQCNTSPKLVNEPPQSPLPTSQTFLDNFNFNITSASTAIMQGTTPCAALDFAGHAQTSPCTIGALVLANTATLNTVTVTPSSATIVVGGSQTFAASCSYSDGSTTPCAGTWTDTGTHSTVGSSTGVVTGISVGTDTNTITYTVNGIFGTSTVIVNAAPAFIRMQGTFSQGRTN